MSTSLTVSCSARMHCKFHGKFDCKVDTLVVMVTLLLLGAIAFVAVIIIHCNAHCLVQVQSS